MKRVLTMAAALLVLAGCTKQTIRERGNVDVPESKTVENVLEKPAGWAISYEGREEFTEDNTHKIQVEHIKVVCPGAGYYIIRTLSPSELKDLYNNDLKAFFEAEAEYLRNDAATYGDKVTDYLYFEEMYDYLFDRMRMGDYLMFLIGMDAAGQITGSYAETAFTLREETPTEEYLKWIGEWSVSDGKTGYPVSIEQGEANYSYIFRGWETGESIDSQNGTVMDQEYLETLFDYDNHNMYFTSQYLGTYEENGRNLDEFFFGKVDIKTARNQADNGVWIIDTEGLDLAAAVMAEDGKALATVSGCAVNVPIGGQDILSEFFMMQYIAGYMNGNEVAYDEYNLNVPEFPLTMTRTKSAVARPALRPRPVTRASLHHAQPRLHTATQRATHAVRSTR